MFFFLYFYFYACAIHPALKTGPPEGFVFWTSAFGFGVWWGRGSVALKIGPPEGFVFWTSASGLAVWFGRGVGLRASSFGLGVGVLDFGMCACISAKHLCMHMYTHLSGWGGGSFFLLRASGFAVLCGGGDGSGVRLFDWVVWCVHWACDCFT